MSLTALSVPATHPNSVVHSDPLPLEFRSVARQFSDGTRERTVLNSIDLAVEPGTVVAVLGPSGCGKSTLLRLGAGLDRPTVGEVLIDGTPVKAYDPRCAVAFQEARLLPWRTVRRNIALGLPRGAEVSLVDELMSLVGLDDFANHRPREISGGMAQRVSLARALARRPGVLLLDEPFGALDALTRIKMQSLLLDLHRAAPSTIVLVTHDVNEAITLADTIVVLGRDPGDNSSVLLSTGSSDGIREDPVATAALHRRLLACLGVLEP